jgi:hypothetical protein
MTEDGHLDVDAVIANGWPTFDRDSATPGSNDTGCPLLSGRGRRSQTQHPAHNRSAASTSARACSTSA